MSEAADGAAVSAERWHLILGWRPRLLRTAQRLCGDVADAEDIVQETLLRAARFGALEEERVERFLHATLRRLAADVHRVRERAHE